MKLEKRFKNSSGDIVVKETYNCGIVEMMHIFDKEKNSGCVIGCWRIVKSDGEDVAEFSSIRKRIMETEYDNSDILLDALKVGQEIADLIIKLTDKENV